MDEQEDKKISVSAMAGWVVLALVGDALTFIPFVGIAVGPLFWIVFNYYLHKKGFPIMNGKRFATGAISTIAEIIPAIQALPTITVGVVLTFGMIRIEQKTGLALPSLAGNKIGPKMNIGGTRLPPTRSPLNQQSIRPPHGGLAT